MTPSCVCVRACMHVCVCICVCKRARACVLSDWMEAWHKKLLDSTMLLNNAFAIAMLATHYRTCLWRQWTWSIPCEGKGSHLFQVLNSNTSSPLRGVRLAQGSVRSRTPSQVILCNRFMLPVPYFKRSFHSVGDVATRWVMWPLQLPQDLLPRTVPVPIYGWVSLE